ncbi:hypothetical protein L5515_009637 [Caenorhabditis briggsae]|uniref:Uncharacterized protein n=1 Tax=Caenorhabditis briggsae TaxID=6238 RepID=A0AAE9F9D0_CAEBR|nr:hypothetical protein L5515_009637 [Caenorhabditis briggsae]
MVQLYNPSASILDLKPSSTAIKPWRAVDDFRAAEQTGYLHWEECTVAGCFNGQPQVKAVPFSTLFLHNQNNTNFGTVFEDNLLDTQNRRCYQCGRRTMREVRIVNGGYLIVSLNRPNDVNFDNFPVDEIVSMYEATWRLEGFARYEGNEREKAIIGVTQFCVPHRIQEKCRNAPNGAHRNHSCIGRCPAKTDGRRAKDESTENRELKAERDHLVNQINARDEYEFDQPIGRPEH